MAQARGKTAAQVIADKAPWKLAEFDPADAIAVQALVKGTANMDQQKRAITWIVKNCCRTYDLSYRPGAEEGRRDTDFAEGRRSVGLQLVMMMNLKIGLIPKQRGEG